MFVVLPGSFPFLFLIMVDNPLATVFGTVGVVYGLVVPLVLIQLFAFFLIASLLNPGAKPRRCAEAMYCYVLMGVGLLIMTIAAVPTVASVLAGESYSNATYIGLLILFATGGVVFLHHDRKAREIESSSRVVPSLIYAYTVKSIGVVAMLLSGLSIVLTLVLGTAETGWWVMPVTVFLYGFILYWSTRAQLPGKPIFCMPTIVKRPLKPGSLMPVRASVTTKSAKRRKGSKKK